ncbi:MAG: hypothetical protein ACRC92_27075 [Peptostreptococcaceae bacterium]
MNVKDIKDLFTNYAETTDYKSQSTTPINAELDCNFTSISDHNKVQILDNLLDVFKDVYGPYGGLYGTMEMQTQQGYPSVIKSKDGNQFFKKIIFKPYYATTLLHLIRQRTDYIASYSAGTSRDGTTSMAVVSSAISKAMLMYRINKGYNIPSTISNILFDIMLEEGGKLIHDNRVMIYNEENSTYTENGKKVVMDAINTTVNNNPIFTEEFERFINDCETRKINIPEMFLEDVSILDGDQGIELRSGVGISSVVSEFGGSKITSQYADKKNLVLFLDGFIDADLSGPIFMRMLEHFLNNHIFTLMDKDTEGVTLILTRSPQYIKDVIKPYSDAGVLTYNPNMASTSFNNITGAYLRDNKMIGKTVRFNVFQIDDTESNRSSFEDYLKIMSHSVIDLNNLNVVIKRYLEQIIELNKNPGVELTDEQVSAARSQVGALMRTNDRVNLFKSNLPEAYEPLMRYMVYVTDDRTIARTLPSGEDMEISKDRTIMEIRYDGTKINFLFDNDDMRVIADTIRVQLKELLDSDKTITNDNLKYRVDMLNTSKIKPVIYGRSEDEKNELFTLMEDSLGVLQSIHVFGVMGGANTTMLKLYDEFEAKCKDSLRNILGSTINEDLLNEYLELFDDLLKSVYTGYVVAYSYIIDNTGDKLQKLLDEYKEMGLSKDMLSNYNVLSGSYNSVVEAARTTVDVFSCAISIAKDLYTIRRFNLNNQEETRNAMIAKHDKALFKPVNTRFLEETTTK